MAITHTYSHYLPIGLHAEHDQRLPSVDGLTSYINEVFGPCELLKSKKQPEGWYLLWFNLDKAALTGFVTTHAEPGALSSAIDRMRSAESDAPPISGCCQWALPGSAIFRQWFSAEN